VGTYGRMKYLKPLYAGLTARPEFVPVARTCFEKFKGRYHPIAQQVVGRLVG
jgi:hypothetical protein